MGRKRKKSDYPDDWDIVEESQDPDAWDLFETVEETQDPDANENEVKQVTTTLSQLQPPSQVLEPDPVYRLKQSTKDVHSSVICKLTRILRVPELLPEIKRISVVMKQVQLEGWHLANLHVLRCLEEGDELQDLDQMFFYRCCAVTLTKHPSFESKFPSFHKSCLRYWERRADVGLYASEEVMHGSAMINETAKLMSINALNMLALHFRRRLHQYVRFRYAPENKTELSYRETKRLVDSCYRVKDVPEKDDKGNLTANTVKDWTQWNDTEDEVELALRKWLKIVPWQWLIRENSAHFLRRLHDMQSFMEKFVEKHLKQKGARMYSLLPVSTSYQAAYVKLNASTLHGLFSRIIAQPTVQAFCEKKLEIAPTKSKIGPPRLLLSLKEFQNNKSKVMSAVFDVTQFETANRKFVDEVKTNGYGASVLMQRPVTTKSVVVVEKKTKASAKKRKSDGTAHPKKPAKKTVKTPEELAEGDTFNKELFKLGPDYCPDVLIGIDPGMRSLVTAATIGHVKKQRTWKRLTARGRRTRRRQRRFRKKITKISTSEYRHLARMNDFRAWNERLKTREPTYAGIIREMPSFKTASYDTYLLRLQYFWTHLRYLLAFSSRQAFLSWRFKQNRAKMKAIDTLAKRLVPKVSKKVCIAYGDWSRRDGIRGHATGPVKGFVEALKKRATVLPMDEFRTSKLCSCCHKHLNQTSLFTKVRQEKDGGKKKVVKKPVKLSEKELKKKAKKEAKEKKEMERFKNPKLKDFKIVLKSNRNVLRCENSRCEANFWNRDVNAARNMLELMKGYFQNLGRMTAFVRGG